MNNWIITTWQKEWIKLRFPFYALFLINIAFFIYLYAITAENFGNIEPETMRWYQALHIGVPFYEEVRFLPLLFGLGFAFWQFSQEMRGKRFRIALHFPVEQYKMVLVLLSSGVMLLLGILIPYLLLLPLVLGQFYPAEGWMLALHSGLLWSLGGIAAYLGASILVLESFWLRRFVLGTLFSGWIALFFMSATPGAYLKIDFILILTLPFFLIFGLYVLERFKHGNADPLLQSHWFSKAGYALTWFLGIVIFSIYIPLFLEKSIGHTLGKSYIFYSPLTHNFVYQDNHGGHHFTYGDSGGAVFDQQEYERRLPFVYWKNLDIREELPITLDGESFGKKEIREGRQSFRYEPSMLPENSLDPRLYPLFNPETHIGSIPFPETMFRINHDGFTFFDADGLIKDEENSKKFTQAMLEAGFKFPSTLIAGKSTNLKPFDEGYFIRDSEGKLFHLKQWDSKPIIKEIALPSTIQIRLLNIAENRKKQVYGYLLDTKERLYLISYDNYALIPLPTPGFKPENMELQLYTNPLYSILRYGDNKQTIAVALDKEYREIKRYSRPLPHVNHGSDYRDIIQWLAPFSIQMGNSEKTPYIHLTFNTGSSLYLLTSALLSILFITVAIIRGKKPIKHFYQIPFILIFGIYGFIMALLVEREN